MMGPGAVVIKPTVSAGSFSTEKFSETNAEAIRFATAVSQTRDVMVQGYFDGVEKYGDRSLVWIAGEFTHSVRKSPRFGTDDESVSDAIPLTKEQLEFGSQVLDNLPFPKTQLLYARVDVIPDADDYPTLAELELIEPSLFLKQSPGALKRLVEAIK